MIDNCLSDLRLNRKNVVERSIVTSSPKMPVSPRINQLGSHSYAVASGLHASLYDVRHAEFARDLAQIPFHTGLVLHDRSPADHFQVGNVRQVSEDFVVNCVGKKRVPRIGTQIFKWQYGDAFLRHVRGALDNRRWFSSGLQFWQFLRWFRVTKLARV